MIAPAKKGLSNGPEPGGFHLGYRKSLDGLRGAAILAVIFYHYEILGGYTGFIGVDLFFALSGFLITCLLIEEWDASKTISLKRFYFRRALRLLPALVLLLAAFVIFSFLTGSGNTALRNVNEALLALFYMTNWARAFRFGHTYVLGHTWSLSIEEQFYLLWPMLLIFLLRRVPRRDSLMCYVVLGAVLSWLERFILSAGTVATPARLDNGLDTRADSLLLGCAAGVCISSGFFPKTLRDAIFLKCAALVSVLILVLLCEFSQPFSDYGYYLFWFLISLCSATIVMELVASPRGILQWIMELPPLVFIGRISYGLYLWHNVIWLLLATLPWPWWKHFAVSVAATAGIALASYYLIEKPCLRLKKRFSPVKTAALLPASATPA